MFEILVLVTTEENERKAKTIARLLIKKNLAACVSIKKIDSIYKWEQNIEETEEFEITIKSKPSLKDDLVLFLQKMTSYDTPQIIYKKFRSESNYYDWLTKTI